jgi:hypothetical protein
MVDVTDILQSIGASVCGRRNQFSEQAEDEDLNPYNNQECAKHQQGTIADVSQAGDPQEGKVGIDAHADEQKRQTNQAKQVQWAALKTTEKQCGKEIKGAAEEALNAVFRFAIPARVVIDGDLAYPEALGMGQHRNIAMQLTVQIETLDDFSAIGLETTVEVPQWNTGQKRGGNIKQP